MALKDHVTVFNTVLQYIWITLIGRSESGFASFCPLVYMPQSSKLFRNNFNLISSCLEVTLLTK